MKKSLLVFCFIVFAVTVLFGKGKQELNEDERFNFEKYLKYEQSISDLNKGEEIDLEGIEIKLMNPELLPETAMLVARILPMKKFLRTALPIYSNTKSDNNFREGIRMEKMTRTESQNSVATLYPLSNLDVFVWNKRNKEEINDHGLEVRIRVSYEYIQGILSDKQYEPDMIFLFEPDNVRDQSEGTWYSLDSSRPGIEYDESQRERGVFEFTISQWPKDDKIMSCGP